MGSERGCSLPEGQVQVNGAKWAAVAAGIKTAAEDGVPRLDLALLELAAGSTISAVFTQNAFCAAPIQVARQHLAEIDSKTHSTYILVNSGNANAGTGEQGLLSALESCEFIASNRALDRAQILPFSTGVIGERLPVEKIRSSVPRLLESLSDTGWESAARAIMTTDTRPKLVAASVEVQGKPVRIAGIAKGAGMIKPNMATMLAYIVTDAKVPKGCLDRLLNDAVNRSFNRITVDGDTSTNDACVLAATGQSAATLNQQSDDWPVFAETVTDVLLDLAQAIIRDAEGASKFITLDVINGCDSIECLKVAYAVAESPLVKTAFFASDANWGRILAAVGRSGVESLNTDAVSIALDGYVICSGGGRVDNYSEETASRIMAQPEVTITIDLSRGEHRERVWTSDLSHDYVRINAEYRT